MPIARGSAVFVPPSATPPATGSVVARQLLFGYSPASGKGGDDGGGGGSSYGGGAAGGQQVGAGGAEGVSAVAAALAAEAQDEWPPSNAVSGSGCGANEGAVGAGAGGAAATAAGGAGGHTQAAGIIGGAGAGVPAAGAAGGAGLALLSNLAELAATDVDDGRDPLELILNVGWTGRRAA